MTQLKWQFDTITVNKILKSIWIALQYGASFTAVAVLQSVLSMDFGMFTPAVAAIVPFAVNFVLQWRKGKEEQLEK